jgi:signal transduction histidine kinase
MAPGPLHLTPADYRRPSQHPPADYRRPSQHPPADYRRPSQHPPADYRRPSQHPPADYRRPSQHPPAVAFRVLGLVTAAVAVGVTVNSSVSDATDLIPFLGVGLLHIEVGLRLRTRRPESWMGPLMTAAGFVWLIDVIGRHLAPDVFAGNMLLSAVYDPIVLHCALIIPVGRLVTTLDRRVVAAGYLFWPVAVLTHGPAAALAHHLPLPLAGVLAQNHSVTAIRSAYYPLVGAGLLVFFVVRYHLASDLYRRSFTPFCTAMVVNTVSTAVAGATFDSRPLWSQLALCAGAIAIPLGAMGSLARSRPPGTMRSLVAELGRDEPGLTALRTSLCRALSDPTVRILTHDPATDTFHDAETGEPARPAGTILRSGTRIIGALTHDPAVAATPDVLKAVQRMAALVLENQRLLKEVQDQLQRVRDSRRRIVEAGDAERRRIERNVHDGVQQRLIAALLLLRRGLPRGGQTDLTLIRQSASELDTAIGELREIARGMNPTILTQHGLSAAVESIAERSGLVLTVDDRLAESRIPIDRAVSAYYVILEAVANAEKHAAATMVGVRLAHGDDALDLTVTDDGVGQATFVDGGGLIGIRDRVEACGGTLTLVSRFGRGTTIRALLPLETA